MWKLFKDKMRIINKITYGSLGIILGGLIITECVNSLLGFSPFFRIFLFAVEVTVVLPLYFSKFFNKNFYSVQKKLEDEFKKLSSNFNEHKTKILNCADLSKGILKDTEQVNSIFQNVSVALDQISQTTNFLANQLSSIAVNAEDFYSGVENTTKNVEFTNMTLGDIKNVSSEGQVLLEETFFSTELLINDLSNLLSAIEKLKVTFFQVNDVSEVITGISEQTSLLSLNASIEAARVGESGRGFSVVAAEIRKLADSSNKEISRIKNIVDNVDSEIVSIKELIEAQSRKGEEVKKSVDSTKILITKIVTSIQRSSAMVNAVFEVSKLQEKHVEALKNKLTHASAAIEEQASSTQEISSSLEEATVFIKEVIASVHKLDEYSNSFFPERG